MKALKIVGIVILAIVAIAVVCVSVMSPRSHMERSIVINAQPAAVYEELTSFKNFNTWSPWATIDPTAKYTFEGPESGVGAKMSWVSDDKNLGEGSQWIIETEQNRRVKTGMKFGGVEGSFTAEFILEPTEGGTKVTWTYDGDVSNTSAMNAAMGKFFGAFTDSVLGPQYEQGLTALKRRVESKPASDPEPQAEQQQ
jgi:carbon monoxide dehydrogenase subunit G